LYNPARLAGQLLLMSGAEKNTPGERLHWIRKIFS